MKLCTRFGIQLQLFATVPLETLSDRGIQDWAFNSVFKRRLQAWWFWSVSSYTMPAGKWMKTVMSRNLRLKVKDSGGPIHIRMLAKSWSIFQRGLEKQKITRTDLQAPRSWMSCLRSFSRAFQHPDLNLERWMTSEHHPCLPASSLQTFHRRKS